MSRYALALLFLVVSGCVVYTPQVYKYIEVVQYQDASRATQVVVDTKVTTETNTTTRTVPPDTALNCPPFELPIARPVPVIPDIGLMQTLDAIDTMLASTIKELQSHVGLERTRLEQAHREWLKRCR